MKDFDKTVNYFNKETPCFTPERYNFCIEMIKKYATPNSSLIDVGCGGGNILGFIKKNTNIQKLAGIEPSLNLLNLGKENFSLYHFSLYHGSILDNSFISTIGETFDFAIIGAVLHHLVGRTRRESYKYAKLALANTIRLVTEGGYILIYEPVFHPKVSMDIVFYVKKMVTTITSDRLGGENNLGAPVVSFFTKEQILKLINSFKTLKILDMELIESRVTPLMRLIGIKEKYSMSIVAKSYKE